MKLLIIEKIRYIINLIIVALLLLTVAVNRDAKIFGEPTKSLVISQEQHETESEQVEADGTRVISSKIPAKGISGYGGATPVLLYIKEGRIEKIEATDNSESPDFMSVVLKSNLLNRWNNLTPEEALTLKVDAVSGATLSSTALIATVHKTLEYVAKTDTKVQSGSFNPLNAKNIAGVLVILLGVASSFIRSKRIRVIQLILNVVVLGFWCGSFLSLSQLVNWCSGGINIAVSLVPLALLTAALLMPLFSRKGHYCAWHCPMGSFQELLGKCVNRKWSITDRMQRYLTYLREFLLWGLLWTMWLGVGFELMDYEIFSAFVLTSAGTIVITMAVLFLFLSCFVHRPYCRFVCPTGTILRFTTLNK